MNLSKRELRHWALVCGVLAVLGCDLQRKPAQPQPQPPPAAPPVEKRTETPKPVVPAAPPKEMPKATEPPKVTQPPKATEPPKVIQPAKAPEPPAKQAALPPELLQIKGEIAQAKAQVDMTIAKLEVLGASTGDLDKPSEEAVAAIESLGASTTVLKTRADDMRQRGATYFEAWEKQLAATSTPAVQALIAKRKDDLSKRYADVLTSMQQTRAAYDTFWNDLQGTVKAIDEGLNPDKVKLFAPTLAKLKEEAKTFKDRIDTTSTKLDQVAGLYTNP